MDSLLARLDGDDAAQRLVTVVRPSGSGKSSVVRAGLLPALRRGRVSGSADWYVTTMTPGAAPFDELEAALLRVAVNPPEQLLGQLTADERGIIRSTGRILPDEHTQLLVVIDQFEELFVLTPEDVRRRFLAALAVAVTDPRSQLRVVATLRADFYDRPLSSSEFAELTKASAITVTPLAPDELEQAIVAPARAAGCDFEEGLIPEILADVAQGSGTLPLLQYALTELYERRSDAGLLTRASYHELGGVVGALAGRADDLMASMTAAHQDAARRLFSRLVTIGEGAADTRRRVTRSEVGADRDMVEVVDGFGAARLLSFDRDAETREPTVEVAHEALITQWATLRDWIDTDREGLRIHRHLTQTASEWQSAERDPGELYRVGRLHTALEWAGSHSIDLNPNERDFLDTSQELNLAEEHKERRRIRRLRTLLVGVAIALVSALVAGVLANSQRLQADDQRAEAQRQAQIADDNADSARARELGIAAINALQDDPELGLLLAIEAAEIDDDVPSDVIDALHQSLQASRVKYTVTSPGEPDPGVAGGVAYSPDGTRLATTGDATMIGIWDADSGERITTVGSELTSFANFPEVAWYGPDEVVAYGGSALEVWDVTTGKRRFSTPSTGPGGGTIATNVLAQRIVTAGFEDDIRVWSGSTGVQLDQTRPTTSSYGVAIDPAGTMLIVASTDRIARLYDLETLDVRSELRGHTDGIIDATFSPDGRRVVTTSDDGTARVWSVDDKDQTELLCVFDEHTGGVVTAEFSPDGRLMATAGNDGRVLIWEADTGTVELELTGHAGALGQLSWHPDREELAVASGGGVIQVFDVSVEGSREVLTIDTESVIRRADVSANGELIATISDDQTARIFSARTGDLLAELRPTGDELPESNEGWIVPDEDIRFSPDNRFVAVANDRGVSVWDVRTEVEVMRLDDLDVRVHSLAWSPDGEQIATVGQDGTLRTWSVATGDPHGSVGSKNHCRHLRSAGEPAAHGQHQLGGQPMDRHPWRATTPARWLLGTFACDPRDHQSRRVDDRGFLPVRACRPVGQRDPRRAPPASARRHRGPRRFLQP